MELRKNPRETSCPRNWGGFSPFRCLFLNLDLGYTRFTMGTGNGEQSCGAGSWERLGMPGTCPAIGAGGRDKAPAA